MNAPSAKLRIGFLDLDKAIEAHTGATVGLIFELEDEAGFRHRECTMLAELTARRGLVLATGGGAVLRPENRATLVSGSTVVYLHTSVEHQLERTARDRNRPLLQTENPRQVLEDLLKIREPLYRSVADIIIETDIRPPRLVVQEILEQLDL